MPTTREWKSVESENSCMEKIPAVPERLPGNRERLWLSVMPSSRAEMTDAALKAWQWAYIEETRHKVKEKKYQPNYTTQLAGVTPENIPAERCIPSAPSGLRESSSSGAPERDKQPNHNRPTHALPPGLKAPTQPCPFSRICSLNTQPSSPTRN